MDASVAVARIQARSLKRTQDLELLRLLMQSDVVQFLAGTLTIEALYRGGLLDKNQRDFGGSAVTVIVGLHALAPSLPYIVQGASAVVKGIGTVGAVGAGLAAL